MFNEQNLQLSIPTIFQHNTKRKPTGFRVASTRASPADIKMSLSHLSGHTWNTMFSFGPHYAKRYGQLGEGPEKGQKGDQRIGKPAITEKAGRTGFAQPWEKKA